MGNSIQESGIEDVDDVPKVLSVFKKFDFLENQIIPPSPDNDEYNIDQVTSTASSNKSSVCAFLEKVQAIFIDEISGAPVDGNSSGQYLRLLFCILYKSFLLREGELKYSQTRL
jgi:hypothetical protein